MIGCKTLATSHSSSAKLLMGTKTENSGNLASAVVVTDTLTFVADLFSQEKRTEWTLGSNPVDSRPQSTLLEKFRLLVYNLLLG